MTQDKVALIFQRVKKDESFKRMFFKKLSTTENPYPWFDKLSKEGYLDPQKNNKNPIINDNNYTIPYWYALDYLENVASHLSKKPDKVILDRLVEVIDSIIDFQKEGERIENPNTDYKTIKIIFLLPIERISEKHIDFIQTALASKFSSILLISSELEKTVIPYLIKQGAKEALLKTLKIILNYKTDKAHPFSFLDFKSVIEDYWLSEILQKNGDKIIGICGISLAELLMDIMKDILQKDKNSFSYAVIHTIEDSDQNFLEGNYQLQLVRFLRRTLENLKPPTQEHMLQDFLKSESLIFKRIGIHVVSYFYLEYNQLFWQWKGNPLEDYVLKHEIYQLILLNKKKIVDAEVDTFLGWVESIKLSATKDAPEGSPQYLAIDAYAKLEWLSALDGIYSEKVSLLIEKYSKFYKGKIEHPGYLLWTSPVQVSIGAPEVFPPEVIAKSNSDLIQYILAYKPKEPSFYQTRADILYSFNGIVRENPDKFASDINPFLNLDFRFQESLISGFTDAWRKNKQFPLLSVLEFLNEITSSQRYNDDKSQEKNFFTKSIADFIFEGTRDEKHVFDDDFLPLCESILLRLTANAYPTVTSDTTDVHTAVLNSPLGILYYALITYSLRFAKVNNKNKEEKWVNSIKAYYQSIIESTRTIEFEESLGTFLPQLYYLDKQWTISNINKLFPKENQAMWKFGFSSYLFHSTTLSKDLYCLLKENGHYKKALESVEKYSFEKLPQHICIAYLNDLENLEKGSLLTDLITGSNVSYLMEFVNFFWHLRGKLDEKMKGKVKPAWGAIISHISNVAEKDKYRGILAHLAYWLILVEDIDEDIANWMKFSNKYIDDVGSMFYVEYLNNHVSKNPEQVADIFYDLLSNANYFPYIEKEEVIALVNSLYERGQKEKANRICNIYLSKGFEFLRNLYERNNPKA